MAAVSVPTLTYFPFPGRVFGLRVSLYKAFGKAGWADNRVSFADWPALKPTTPLKSLPTLELPSGETIVQTQAIARWAAKRAGLYPDDPLDALRVDEVAQTAFEILDKCPHDPDPEVKRAKRLEYGENFMRTAMGFLEKKMSHGSPLLLPSFGLSLADLQLFVLTDMILISEFDHIDPTYMDAFPVLMASHAAVAKHELVVDYRANYTN